MTPPRLPRSRLVAGCLLAALALATTYACGNGSDDASSASADGASIAAERSGGSEAGGGSIDSADASAGASEAFGPDIAPGTQQGATATHQLEEALTQRAEIKTASISLHSRDIVSVLADIDALVTTRRGVVDSEDTHTNPRGVPVSASIVVRVPVDQFDAAVDEISTFGRLVREQTLSEDVTTEVADINSRVESAKDSIDQLRRLFGAATELGDIIRLESELSQRQADLEALQAQQRVLADQTTLSTISITVSQPPKKPAPPKDDEDRAGFLGGLQQGWDGLVSFVSAVSHGFGVVLPLATLFALLGLAVWFVVRRLSLWPRTHTTE